MGEYIRLYETENEFQDKRENDYFEPWVSLTIGSDNRVDYNKTEEEKLLGSYLTFRITGDGDIRWHTNNATQARTIQYKKNDEEWTTITSATGNSAPSIAVVSGDTVQFKGDNEAYAYVYNIYGDVYYNSFSGSTCEFEAYGNIMSLIDSDDFENVTAVTANAALAYLFFRCTGLTSVSDLMLPAKTLSGYTYEMLFSYCSSLTDYPRIYAETLGPVECMRGLFYHCTSLTGVPKDYLPWTTVPEGAYIQMFIECSSLVAAPDLPATTVGDNGYVEMFYDCTSLANVPKMAATTAGYRSMAQMFQNCTSLTGVPADFIQVTAFASSNTFESMFQNCTALTYGPERIPARALSAGTCVSMFYGCTSLLKAPEIIATELGRSSCSHMFRGCSSLVSTQSVLPATVLDSNCYWRMFQDCTSLTGAPELPAATVPASGYSSMFSGCTNLRYIKCLATDVSASGALYGWVDGVPNSSDCVFVKSASMSSWPRGASGIPTRWTVQDAT